MQQYYITYCFYYFFINSFSLFTCNIMPWALACGRQQSGQAHAKDVLVNGKPASCSERLRQISVVTRVDQRKADRGGTWPRTHIAARD